MKSKIQSQNPGNGDFIDLKLEANNDIKIMGFKHKEIKIEVQKIIDRAKSYNLPDYWEDQVELLTKEDNEVMIKNVAQASNEWNRLEANFKLTMPRAQI